MYAASVEATLTIAHFSSKYKTFCSYRPDSVYYRVANNWDICGSIPILH